MSLIDVVGFDELGTLQNHLPIHWRDRPGNGWHEDEFFIFLGTVGDHQQHDPDLLHGHMPEEFSELIRTGNLDFALLKPIDNQFLISFPRVNWAQLPNGILGLF